MHTISEMREALKSKKISATELVQNSLAQIDKHDSKLGAVITLNKDEALKKAKNWDSSRPGRLSGVPILLKDMFCTQGLKTTAGSKMLADYVPPFTSSVVEKLTTEGAIIIGKLNQDEFAMGSSNENSAFGVCRNPWNTDYVPGGSSGGSAAAVAARYAPLSLGTDTGGSVRQPAHFCGVVGVKPTYGRMSRYGVVAFASSLDQAGPMALTVDDAALATEIMSGYDSQDSTTSLKPVPKWSEETSKDVKSMKVGIAKEYMDYELDPEVKALWLEAQKELEASGAELVDISLALSEYAVSVYYIVCASEASSNLSRFDGVRFGHRTNKKDLESLEQFYCQNRSEAFGAEVQRRIALGTFTLSSGFYDAYYIKAAQVRRLMKEEFNKVFKQCDVILSPVASSPAFKIGERFKDSIKMFTNDHFTTPVNISGLPAMTVPLKLNTEGLPMGLQIVAQDFNESQMFQVGRNLESKYEFYKEVPHGL